jgi:hypothetical protein
MVFPCKLHAQQVRDSMSHSNIDRMIDYWTARRGDAPATARADIDPADFADIITHAFMIGRARPGAYSFRLVGALLEDLHRGARRGGDFLDLWTVGDRSRLQTAIESAANRGDPLLAEVLGRSLQGQEAKLEIMLAPLLGPMGRVDRILGFYQPVSPLFRLQNQSIERLFLQDIAFVGTEAATASPLRIAAVDGRRIA